jgi:hypothetical protein
MNTRFDGWSRHQCVMVLIMLLTVLCMSLVIRPVPIKLADVGTGSKPAEMTDAVLYQNVIRDVSRGADYYDAAARQHRVGNFPLRPFFTVRFPTLAWLSSAFGPALTQLTMAALVCSVVAAWFMTLRATLKYPRAYCVCRRCYCFMTPGRAR